MASTILKPLSDEEMFDDIRPSVKQNSSNIQNTLTDDEMVDSQHVDVLTDDEMFNIDEEYSKLSKAETGGEADPWIRTKVIPKKGSSA